MEPSEEETGGVRTEETCAGALLYGWYLRSGGGSWKLGREDAAGRRAVKV